MNQFKLKRAKHLSAIVIGVALWIECGRSTLDPTLLDSGADGEGRDSSIKDGAAVAINPERN